MLIGINEKNNEILGYFSKKYPGSIIIDIDCLIKEYCFKNRISDENYMESDNIKLDVLNGIENNIMKLVANNMDRKVIVKYSQLDKLIIFNKFNLTILSLNDDFNVDGIYDAVSSNTIKRHDDAYQLKVDLYRNDWEKELDKFMDFNVDKSSDLVSIIVPVYNVSNYLVDCVESIKKQTYKNIEIILVNDGSLDNSLEICNYLAKTDSRIKVISQNNQGLPFARNKGLDYATGKYICFADSDDYIEYNMIEELVKQIKISNTDFCQCGLVAHMRDGSKFDLIAENRTNVVIDNKTDLLEAYANTRILIGAWDKIYKKEVLDEIRFTNDCFKEDADFVYRLVSSGKTCSFVPKALYHYMKRPSKKNTITSNKISYKLFGLKEWGIEKYNELINEDIKYEESARKILYNCLSHIIKYYIRDYKRGVLLKGEFQDEIQDTINKILILLYNSEDISKYRDIDNVLEIIDFFIKNEIVDKNKLPKYTIKTVGILWNSLNNKQKEEILSYINSIGTLISVRDIDLKDNYGKFIDDIYKVEHSNSTVIYIKKLSLIGKYKSDDIIVFEAEIPITGFSKFKKIESFEFIPKEIAEIKANVRNYFRNIIDNYVYDNIIHLTVSEKEYAYTKTICDSYLNDSKVKILK